MENATPDVLEQIPAGGKQSTPASGAYGEGVALERLQSALPNTDPQQPQEVSAAPPVPSGPSPVPPPSPGLPAGMFQPSSQPGTPVSTPLTEYGPQVPGSAEEAVLQALQALSNDPERTEASREWARAVRDRRLISAQ